MRSNPTSAAVPARDHVLIISYLFPPCGGVGVQRVLGYAKYLPRHARRVFILTARNAATAVYDPGLLRQIPSGVAVIRTFTPELPYAIRNRIWKGLAQPGRNWDSAAGATGLGTRSVVLCRSIIRRGVERLLCPDPQAGWCAGAVSAASRIIREHGIGTVLVNVPPFSSLKIGVSLRRRFSGLNIITDFRDEWLGYHLSSFEPGAGTYKRKIAEELERAAVLASNYVIAVTDSQRRQIRTRYPNQPEGKFLCVPNGYDPDAFRAFEPRPHDGPRMRVTYVGTVYDHPFYSPRPYLDAIERLPDEIRSSIETCFVGRIAPEVAREMTGRRSLIRQLGFMPQAEAFRQLEETDYTLLIVGGATAQAGKLFEYMATGKPILALCPPDGEAARVIRETRTGWCADPADAGGIAGLILRAFGRLSNEAALRFAPDWPAIRAYERPNLAAQVAALCGITTGTAALASTGSATGAHR